MHKNPSNIPADIGDMDDLARIRTRNGISEILTNPKEWQEISTLLFKNNPEKAAQFMSELEKIRRSQDKTVRLLEMLKKHSKLSAEHCGLVASLAKYEEEIKGSSGSAEYDGIDFKDFITGLKLHDIGKIIMPSEILDPPGGKQYTEHDTTTKEKHPWLGYLILKNLGYDDNVIRLALSHHLRYETVEGNLKIVGYPVAKSEDEGLNEFEKFCRERDLKVELTAEDHLAAFTDIYSALREDRPSKLHIGPKDHESTMNIMRNEYFNDDFYTKGPGKQIFDAFEIAMRNSGIFKGKKAA